MKQAKKDRLEGGLWTVWDHDLAEQAGFEPAGGY